MVGTASIDTELSVGPAIVKRVITDIVLAQVRDTLVPLAAPSGTQPRAISSSLPSSTTTRRTTTTISITSLPVCTVLTQHYVATMASLPSLKPVFAKLANTARSLKSSKSPKPSSAQRRQRRRRRSGSEGRGSGMSGSSERSTGQAVDRSTIVEGIVEAALPLMEVQVQRGDEVSEESYTRSEHVHCTSRRVPKTWICSRRFQ